MKINFAKLNYLRGPKVWVFILLLIAVGFLFPHSVFAGLGVLESFIVSVISYILYAFIWVVGQLLVVVIWILVEIAQYNNFINDDTVVKGWTIVRDLCNMFFILIMLVVAFGTILRLQGYGVRTLLKSVIIMAILINFSRLICGLIIDFAQVIMLTFVNAFKGMGGANITNMLGIDKLLAIDKSTSDAPTGWEILGSFALALIYSLVALVVMIALVASLAMRMVMLWIYIILSPFAYLLAILPTTKSYSKKWWEEFSKNVVVGPVLAFFIWLSLATLGTYTSSDDFYNKKFPNANADSNINKQTNFDVSPRVPNSEVGTTKHMMSFIISIGLLVGGLMVAQQVGGAAGGVAGKAAGKVFQGYKRVGKRVGKRATQVTGLAAAGQYMSDRRAAVDAKWDARTARQSAWIAGKAEQGKKATVGKAGKFVDKQWGRFGRNQAEDLRKKARQAREQVQGLQIETSEEYKEKKAGYERMSTADITNALINQADVKMAAGQEPNFETKDAIYKYSIGRGWEDESGKQMDDEQMAKIYRKHYLDKEIEETSKSLTWEAKVKERQAKVYENNQAKWNKRGKAALAIGGTALGFATGGAGFAVLGAPVAVKAAKGAGSIDAKLSTKFHLEDINDARKKLSDSSSEAILTMMDDKSKTNPQRMAATWEAMDRQLLSKDEIEERREEMSSLYGGSDANDKFIPWQNKVIGSKFEALANKTQGAGYLFTVADSKNKNFDEWTKREASDRIALMASQGKIKMKDMDMGALEGSIEQLSRAISNKNFKKEFDNLDTAKQKGIIKALNDHKHDDSYDVKSKLAMVTDVNTGFRGINKEDEFRRQYVKNLSIEDLSDIITKGTNKKRSALQNFIQGDRSKVDDSVLRDDSSKAKSVRNYFDLDQKTEQQVFEGLPTAEVKRSITNFAKTDADVNVSGEVELAQRIEDLSTSQEEKNRLAQKMGIKQSETAETQIAKDLERLANSNERKNKMRQNFSVEQVLNKTTDKLSNKLKEDIRKASDSKELRKKLGKDIKISQEEIEDKINDRIKGPQGE